MKAQELREKSTQELTELLEQLEDTGFRLRLQHYTGQLKRVSSLGATRKEIARVRTVLQERVKLVQAKERLAALEAHEALQSSARLQAERRKLQRQRAQLTRVVGEA